MNEETIPCERKYEIELTMEEIELLKECLRERNNILQRNLYQSITVQNAIESDKKHSYDDDFKEWNNRKLSAQYKEQAMIAHIENVFKWAKEKSVSRVHCKYDLCYINKNVRVSSPWNSKSSEINERIITILDGVELMNEDYMVRFEASLDREGYDILIKRR